MPETSIPEDHPRYASLLLREAIINGWGKKLVATAGLIAHGRGEAFDYLIGEKTGDFAGKAIKAAACCLLTAERPVLSVNGNVAALCPKELVTLAKDTGAALEINLFYRSGEREEAILDTLKRAGAEKVLGVGRAASATIPELSSERRRVDPEGILKADVVMVPLEDGDRTEGLVKMGKIVITIDLNPLSRTSQKSTITIVDNVVRAMPVLIKKIRELKSEPKEALKHMLASYNNRKTLNMSLAFIAERLARLAEEKTEPDSNAAGKKEIE